MPSTRILKILDKVIGGFLSLLLLPFLKITRLRCYSHPNKTKRLENRLLVVKLWAIGDSILLLPTLKALRLHFPSARISILATEQNSEVFRGFSCIDDVIELNIRSFGGMFLSIFRTVVELRKRRFEVVIDAEPFTYFSAILACTSKAPNTIGFKGSNEIKSYLYDTAVSFEHGDHAVHRYLSLLRPLGVLFSTIRLERISTTDDDEKYAESILAKESYIDVRRPKIGVYPGPFATVSERQWPTSNFVELCDTLCEREHNVILVGSKSEEPYIFNCVSQKMRYHPVILAGKTTIKQLAALMENLDLFVSSDSGPLHIASAMGIPTVALFGPGDPACYGPLDKQSILLYKKPMCGPCIDSFKGYARNCKEKTCMRTITVEKVLFSIERILDQNRMLHNQVLDDS